MLSTPKESNIQILVLLFSIAVGMIFCPVAVKADVSISGLDDITINAWNGLSNDLEGTDTYCAISCSNNCNQPRHYDVAAYTSGPTDGAGNFYLVNTADGTTTLRVTFEWINPVRGTFTMTNYNVTGYTAPPSSPFAPGATSCADPNSQNTIRIRIAAADLATALAGTYSGTLYIDLCRLSNSGNSTFECVAPVNFTVTLPELTQLTQLQDFSLGNWVGVGNAQATDDFCVFRNGYGGFAITANGNNDSGGNFKVSSGTNTLPYSIEFSDGGAWYSAAPGSTLNAATTGFTGNSTRDCGGGTSHKMRVTLQQLDLGAAQAGAYSDTVTIRIEPQ